MILRGVLMWIALAAMAILNAAVRETLIRPRVGERAGHVISTVALCLVILFLAWLTIPWIGVRTVAGAWGIGAVWLTLTVAFEFLAGHYLFGSSWEKILADYNVLRGRVWPLVLIACLLAPLLAHRLRND